MAVDILMEALAGIDVDVLLDVNENAFAGVTTAKFNMPAPLEGLNCRAAFDCRPIAALDCASVLQAWIPLYHV